jgi:hypothetical protein
MWRHCMCFGFSSSSSKEKKDWVILGVLVQIGFYGLLRPGEILKLRRSDVCVPSDALSSSELAVLRIVRPKNRRAMGFCQFAVVRSKSATDWLSWLVKDLGRDDFLWSGSPQLFRRLFKQLTNSLQLQTLELVPASLRAGGATYCFLQGVEVSRLRFWGRWSSEKSLEHYVQEAMAAQLSMTLGDDAAQLIHDLLTAGSFLERVPTWSLCSISRAK